MLLDKLLKIESITRKDNSKLIYLTSEINKNKETIIFINGWGNNRTIWENTFIYFIEKYNILIYEPPGHGLNHVFRKKSSLWTMEDFADDVYLITKNINKLHLIGHSIGGMIIQQYISNKKRNKKVKSIVLISSEYKNPLDMLNLKLKIYKKLLEKLKFKYFENLIGTLKKLRTKQNPNYVIKQKDFIIQKPIILFLKSSLFVDSKGLIGCSNAMKNWRKNITKPEEVFDKKQKILVIYSEKDLICSPHQSKEIGKLSNTKIFSLGKNSNHNAFFTKMNDQSIQKIKDFF